MALNRPTLRQAARKRRSPPAAPPGPSRMHPTRNASAHRTAPANDNSQAAPWPNVVRLAGEEMSTSGAAASGQRRQLSGLHGLQPSRVRTRPASTTITPSHAPT